jgi:hypothetical protein
VTVDNLIYSECWPLAAAACFNLQLGMLLAQEVNGVRLKLGMTGSSVVVIGKGWDSDAADGRMICMP